MGGVGGALGDQGVETRSVGEGVAWHATVAVLNNYCTGIVCTRIVTARAAVTYISFSVTVAVLLKRVRIRRAIIGNIRNAITVGIRRQWPRRRKHTVSGDQGRFEAGEPILSNYYLYGCRSATTVALAARNCPEAREEIAGRVRRRCDQIEACWSG
jgi:hypothetical protein